MPKQNPQGSGDFMRNISDFIIDAPLFTVVCNGETLVCNEYTVRNIRLAVAKKELNDVTVNGHAVNRDGSMSFNIPELGICDDLAMELWNYCE